MIPQGGPATEFPAARPAAAPAVLCVDYNLLLIPESIWMRPCRICSPYGLSRTPFGCAPVAFAHHTASLEGHLDAPLSHLLTIRPL